MLDVPFFPNDGRRCMQASMRSLLKYYLDRDYSLDYLDQLTGRSGDLWTWTPQAVAILYDLGLDVKFYTKTPLAVLHQGKSWIYEQYGDEADSVLKCTNLPHLIESCQKLEDSDLIVKAVLPFEEIERHIDQNHVPLMLIDFGPIDGKPGYHGHFVIVTGYDAKKVYFHDSGPTKPTPNDCATKEKFIEGWNSKGTDNDLILTFGRR